MGLEGIHNTPTDVPTDLGCRRRAYWDVETGNLITESKQQHDWVVISVTFSHVSFPETIPRAIPEQHSSGLELPVDGEWA